jgi:hypothetical protein
MLKDVLDSNFLEKLSEPIRIQLKKIEDYGVKMNNLEGLTIRELLNMETALFNVSIGVPTRDLYTLTSRLHVVELGKRLGRFKEVVERAYSNKRARKLLDDAEKLRRSLQIMDLSMADTLFDVGSGKILYRDFFAPVIESAINLMQKDKSVTLMEFAKSASELNSRARRPQRYFDLSGMIMTQIDYESNQNKAFDEDGGEIVDYFGYVLRNPNDIPTSRDLRDRTKIAYQNMRFGTDGRLDLDGTLATIRDENIRKSIRSVIDSARKTLDGRIKEYNIANSIRRGKRLTMMENYFPRMVRKSSSAQDDSGVQFNEIYKSSNLMPTITPGSMFDRVDKINPVEIDISKVMTRSVTETFTDYHLSPSFSEANSALRKKERAGGKSKLAFAGFREALKDRLVRNYNRELDKDGIVWLRNFGAWSQRMARYLLLAKIPKTATEFLSNQIGMFVSDGVIGWGNPKNMKVLNAIADDLNLTSAKNIVKYNEIFDDARRKKMNWGERSNIAIITINDTLSSSAIYEKTFKKLFKEYSGRAVDFDQLSTNDDYRDWATGKREGGSYFERAHIGALARAQESFTTVNRALNATHTRIVPGVGNTNVSVDNLYHKLMGFMMSFSTNEAFESLRGIRQIAQGIKNKDGDLVRDGMARVASRFVRTSIYSAATAQLGYAIGEILRGDDGDDDDGTEIIVDPLKVGVGSAVSLVLGRYGNIASVFSGVLFGGLKALSKDTTGNTEFVDGVVESINDANTNGIYITPMSANMPLAVAAKRVLPAYSLVCELVYNSVVAPFSIYNKLEKGESLTEDEKFLWGLIVIEAGLSSLVYPNLISSTTFNIGRNVESSIRRDERNKKNRKKKPKRKVERIYVAD